nr:hypothetical protein [Tanacetum cinerariifolium]
MSYKILHVHPTIVPTFSNQDLQYEMMMNNEKLQRDDLSIWWSLNTKFDKSTPSVTHCRTAAIRPRDHDDHHDDAHPEGEHNDDEVPTKEVSQDLWEEISEEIFKARLKKAESRNERLSSPTLKKPTPVFQSCQRNPKAQPMTLLNQDLLYLKHGNSGKKKYTLSLHKFVAVPFPDNDMEEQTSR